MRSDSIDPRRGFGPDGSFHLTPEWDSTLLTILFRLVRERILTRPFDRHAIFQELVRSLLA